MQRPAGNQNVKTEIINAPTPAENGTAPIAGATYTQPATGSPATGNGAADVEPFIDKREVARRLGRTVRTINNLMRQGRIPFYKFDARISFRWSEVEARLTQPCQSGTPGGAR